MSGEGAVGVIDGFLVHRPLAFTARCRALRLATEWKALASVVLISFALSEARLADAAVVHTIGTAYDLRSEKPLYSEAHCAGDSSLEREVIYRDTGERLLAHKTLDYRTGQATPSYVQRNFYAGESVGVALLEDTLEMTIGDLNGVGETFSVQIESEQPLVIDAGFDAFIRENWDALIADQRLRFEFPFAAREDLFALRISASPCSYDTATDQCFRLELDNWLLRALLDPIELGYDASLKRLARYRGLSNIGDSTGEGQVVDIRYRYEDLPAVACEFGDDPVADMAPALDTPSLVYRL